MGFGIKKGSAGGPFAMAQAISDARKGAQFAVASIFGAATLVAGTVTVSKAGVTAQSVVLLTLTTPGGATQGVKYKVVPSTGQFIITGVDNTGATVATDTSTFNYEVRTPQYHGDVTAASSMNGDYSVPGQTALSVTAANAVDLPTSILSANNLRQVLNLMMADAVAHLIADAVNPVVAALAVDLPTTITLLNACKVSFNAHLAQAGVHVTNDTVNTVATANATDLPSSQTLANALKAAVNLHLASAPFGESVLMIGP